MMNVETKYGLYGAFKVDFLEGGKMVSGTNWFSNFITATGLSYPLTYNFVDCFRYLSLGSNPQPSKAGLNGSPTTGLYTPIDFIHTDGVSQTQTAQYIGYQGYNKGDSNANSLCSTILTNAGPVFFRSWTVPTGTDLINEPGGGLTINEFMVSPGSGNEPGSGAFSRIARQVYIPNGQQVIISYQLAIKLQNTGITSFAANTFTTTNADITNDEQLVKDWETLSGYYRQSWMGLTCIDPYGAPFMPTMGNGMEPCLTNFDQFTFYLSPDNSQFDVNRNGGAQTDENLAYAADGLMGLFLPNDLRNVGEITVPLDDDFYFPTTLTTRGVPAETVKNIRLGGGQEAINVPSLENYAIVSDLEATFDYQGTTGACATGRAISYASPGSLGFDLNQMMGYQKAAFSSRIYRLPVTVDPTSRTRKITRKTVFPSSAAQGTNTRYGSLVYAYKPEVSRTEDNVYYPTIDCLFFDASGRSLMQHYREIKSIYLTERGTGVVDAYVTVPNSGDNVRFTSRKCFQGGYSANDPQHFSTASPYVGIELGCLFSGDVNSNLVGDASSETNGGVGAGGVYGCIVDSAFNNAAKDIGLADHVTGMTSAPSPTGQLYYPYCKPGNEMNVVFTGVKLNIPALGVVEDTEGYFVKGQQIISTIQFALSDGSHSANLKNVTDSPTSSELGYFLTTQQYHGTVLTSSDNSNFIVGTSYTATGCVDAYQFAENCSPISEPSNYFSITPSTTTSNLSAGTFSVSNAVRVNGLFTSEAPFVDRGYGSTFDNGSGFNIKNNYEFWLTGKSSASPVYLTYVYGAAGTYTANSMLTGTVTLTKVAGPEGVLLHKEASGRLLPNHGIPNNSGVNVYYPQVGGAYPGLSLDNNLELYFDISWFAPCKGGADDCGNNP